MTTEFRIDRPGVYRRRDGEHVYLWPTFSRSPLRWFALFAESPMSYKDNGGFWINGEESSFDVVAYVCRLPEEILQRMLDALAAAEYQPEQAAPATFAEAIKALTPEQPQ